MRFGAKTALLGFGFCAACSLSAAQTLGDLARQERARRAQETRHAPVITNEDLKRDRILPLPPLPLPQAATPATLPAGVNPDPLIPQWQVADQPDFSLGEYARRLREWKMQREALENASARPQPPQPDRGASPLVRSVARPALADVRPAAPRSQPVLPPQPRVKAQSKLLVRKAPQRHVLTEPQRHVVAEPQRHVSAEPKHRIVAKLERHAEAEPKRAMVEVPQRHLQVQPKPSVAPRKVVRQAPAPVHVRRAQEPDPNIVVVEQGDSLWRIASDLFGDGRMWKAIWEANPGITNPNRIYAGQTLRVPTPRQLARVLLKRHKNMAAAKPAGNVSSASPAARLEAPLP